MKVAVVGAAGKMGAWFCGYFARHKYGVSAFDVRPFSIGRVENAKSLARCVRDADLVVVCVPVKHTPSVIKQCARHMKAGASLAEISSVKDRTLPALKKTRNDVLKLCVHPMFGPGQARKSSCECSPCRCRAGQKS
ncbi:prephenate dehydrogenase/arogenate dehydrogenase family protein [Candidatus Nitrososphaera sp. FF02]|uniref:prephenate dehydrogenase/arogenate dehydrogenase family protein n=1 Tax=Candidatus Nitrososphaera sp. FF02 TaxID=3398226 RepID=UPI0039E958D3